MNIGSPMMFDKRANHVSQYFTRSDQTGRSLDVGISQ